MIRHPLTNLQAWGLEDDEMPPPEKKDLFDDGTKAQEENETEAESDAGPGGQSCL